MDPYAEKLLKSSWLHSTLIYSTNHALWCHRDEDKVHVWVWFLVSSSGRFFFPPLLPYEGEIAFLFRIFRQIKLNWNELITDSGTIQAFKLVQPGDGSHLLTVLTLDSVSHVITTHSCFATAFWSQYFIHKWRNDDILLRETVYLDYWIFWTTLKVSCKRWALQMSARSAYPLKPWRAFYSRKCIITLALFISWFYLFTLDLSPQFVHLPIPTHQPANSKFAGSTVA